MDSINNNWKSIFLFSTIFFILGYLVGNSFKGHKPMGGVFISDDIKGMDHMGNFLKDDGENEHIIIKKFKNGKGTIDVNIDSEMDIDKIIKEAEGDPNMTIKIDSTLKDGKKEIRVEVRKEIHSEH
jgi:predicted proteasome-type protease